MLFATLKHDKSWIVPYRVAWEFQKELVEKRAQGEIPDTIIFCEHPSTITRGRGLQFTGEARERHAPLGPIPEGTEFFEIERGGDLTWHGPGQLVIYPIIKLDGTGFGPDHDVTGFLRKIERVLGSVLIEFGLMSEMREKATGVWVGDRKLASIGIAVRKWVTYHGIAINVVNDLAPFRMISPCGFSPEVMSSLVELAPQAFAVRSAWRSEMEIRLARKFAGQTWPKGDERAAREIPIEVMEI